NFHLLTFTFHLYSKRGGSPGGNNVILPSAKKNVIYVPAFYFIGMDWAFDFTRTLTGAIMCGIAGVVNFRQPENQETILNRMLQALRHRGPDASGLYMSPVCGLGHAR